MEQTEKIISEQIAQPARMSVKFILAFACWVTVINWILLFTLVFAFDDHFPGEPPPGILEMAVSYLLWVLAFPVFIASLLIKHDPPYFSVSCTLLFFLGGFFWGTIVEKIRQWKRSTTVSKKTITMNHIL